MVAKDRGPGEDDPLPPAVRKLSAHEARRVLLHLLRAHPELHSEAEKAALDEITEIDREALAQEIQSRVESIGFDDLGGGRRRGGYIHPSEEALMGLERVIEPYLEEMRRLVSLGQKRAAVELCRGIVLGLEPAEVSDATKLLAHAPEVPVHYARRAEEILAEESRREHGEPWRLWG